MKLPVAEIMVEAFHLPWRHRQEFSRALVMPLLGLIVLNVGTEYALPMIDSKSLGWLMALAWGSALLNIALFSWLAICCHRLVLLGADSQAMPRRWSLRETRFVLTLLALYVIAFTVAAPSWLLISNTPLSELEAQWQAQIASIPALYVFARLSLLFPAIAIDRPSGMQEAWGRSQNNGWRLFVIVCILPFLLSAIFSVFGPARNDNGLWSIASTLLATVLLVFEISALSLAYRFLKAPDNVA